MLGTPQIYKIKSFDATKSVTVRFSYVGAPFTKSIWNITRDDGAWERTLEQNNSNREYTFDGNLFTNGHTYYIKVRVINTFTLNESKYSDVELFFCSSVPDISIKRVTDDDESIELVHYVGEASARFIYDYAHHNLAEEDIIYNYKYYLFSITEDQEQRVRDFLTSNQDNDERMVYLNNTTELTKESVQYYNLGEQYELLGLDSGTRYILAIRGETTFGMDLFNWCEIVVSYSVASSPTMITLTNRPITADVFIQSNVISIDGTAYSEPITYIDNGLMNGRTKAALFTENGKGSYFDNNVSIQSSGGLEARIALFSCKTDVGNKYIVVDENSINKKIIVARNNETGATLTLYTRGRMDANNSNIVVWCTLTIESPDKVLPYCLASNKLEFACNPNGKYSVSNFDSQNINAAIDSMIANGLEFVGIRISLFTPQFRSYGSGENIIDMQGIVPYFNIQKIPFREAQV